MDVLNPQLPCVVTNFVFMFSLLCDIIANVLYSGIQIFEPPSQNQISLNYQEV